MSKTTHLFFAFPETDLMPEFIQLLPAGEFSAIDGRGPYRVPDISALLRAFERRGKIPVDENHSTDLSGPEGFPAPAIGWIVSLEERAGEIWGRVEWNSRGRALLEDRAYRGVSPVLSLSESGDVFEIIRAALTNDPALTQLKTLHSRSKEHIMPIINQLRAAAGLPETATEAELLDAVTSQFQFVQDARAASGEKTAGTFEPVLKALHAKQGGNPQNVQADLIADAEEAAGLQKGAGLEASVRALCSVARSSGDQTTELRKTVLSLQTNLDRVQQEFRRKEAEHFVDEAIKAGKPIRALRNDYIDRYCREPEPVIRELNALPSINDGGVVNPRKDGDVYLTPEDEHMIATFGFDRDTYIKQKKAEREQS